MSKLERIIAKINIMNIGEFIAEFPRTGAPHTIAELESNLPISSRGIKRNSRFTFASTIRCRSENPQTNFQEGEISFDPRSSNMTIHIQTGNLLKPENLVGKITSDLNNLKRMRVTHGIMIKEIS